jgi:hypothetical protein
MMKNRLSNIIGVLVLVIVAGCTGTKNSAGGDGEDGPASVKVAVTPDSLDEALDRIDPKFNVSSDAPDQFYFAMLTGGGGKPEDKRMETLRGIQSVTFEVFGPDNKLVGSTTTDDIISSGVMNGETGEASLTLTASVEWSAPSALAPGSYAVMTIHSRGGKIARRHPLPITQGALPHSSKVLNMWLESRDMGTGVEFILHVERLAPSPAGEYLPSGEQFRIELENNVGETLWSSSHEMAFIQSIGQVEPAEVGKTIEYRAVFDGRNDLTKSKLAPGIYRIVATIPAKPQPYILPEEFTWSGE